LLRLRQTGGQPLLQRLTPASRALQIAIAAAGDQRHRGQHRHPRQPAQPFAERQPATQTGDQRRAAPPQQE
jgi:hypothetical protein